MRRTRKCAACKNHDKDCLVREHLCPYRYCECLLCDLTRKVRDVMRKQQKCFQDQKQLLYKRQKDPNFVFDRSILDSNGKIHSSLICYICKSHYQLTSNRDHNCPYINCKCSICQLIFTRRQVMKHQQRIKRLRVMAKVVTSDVQEYSQIRHLEYASKKKYHTENSAFYVNQIQTLSENKNWNEEVVQNESTHIWNLEKKTSQKANSQSSSDPKDSAIIENENIDYRMLPQLIPIDDQKDSENEDFEDKSYDDDSSDAITNDYNTSPDLTSSLTLEKLPQETNHIGDVNVDEKSSIERLNAAFYFSGNFIQNIASQFSFQPFTGYSNMAEANYVPEHFLPQNPSNQNDSATDFRQSSSPPPLIPLY